MRKKPEIADLSTRLLVVALGSDRRWKRVITVGAIAAAFLGAAVYGVVQVSASSDHDALQGAFSNASTCLLGDALKDGETAGSRVLEVQLTAVGIPRDRRAKANEAAWPASCAPYAFEIASHATSAAQGGEALATSAGALAKMLKEDTGATSDFRAEADQLWKDAKAAGLVAGAPAGATAPFRKSPLFASERYKALPRFLNGTFGLSSVHESPYSERKIHFVVDQKDAAAGPAICTATETGPTVSCMKVPPAVAQLSPGLSLVGTSDDRARPFYFAGDRGQLGIFPPDGDHAVEAAVAYGASARDDGALYLVTENEISHDVELGFIPATGRAQKASVLRAAEVDDPSRATVLWDWFVAETKGKPKAHLVARKLAQAGGAPAAAIDIGELDDLAPASKADKSAQLGGCRTDEATIVRAAGARNDALAFFTAGRWSAPVKAPTHGGALTCRGLTAVTTQVEPGADPIYPVIQQGKCNAGGCTQASIGMREIVGGLPEIAPADGHSTVAADIGGKLLVAWNAGYVGGLRMRFAAPEQLKNAEDTVISDLRDAGAGKLSTFVEMRVIPTSTYAILFVSTTTGVRLFRIDGAGAVTPLQSAM